MQDTPRPMLLTYKKGKVLSGYREGKKIHVRSFRVQWNKSVTWNGEDTCQPLLFPSLLIVNTWHLKTFEIFFIPQSSEVSECISYD